MTIDGMIQAATAHHQAGRLADAEALYRQVLQRDPDQPDALHLLGLIAHQIGRHDQAAGLIARAIQLKPSGLMYGNLGFVFAAQGKPDLAADCLRQAVALMPDNGEAHFNLGNLLKLQGKIEEAVQQYRQAIACRPDYADAHYNLGVLLQEQNKLDEAVEQYRRVIKFKANHAEAHNNLAGALQISGRLDEAAQHYRQLIAIKPESAAAHFSLAGVLKLQDRQEEAIESARKAIACQPGFSRAHAFLGSVLIDTGRFDEADAEVTKALQSEPGNLLAHALQVRLRKMTAADTAWLEQAIRLIPTDGSEAQTEDAIALQFAIGKYYDDTKQYDQAFTAFRQANGLRRRRDGVLDRDGLTRLVDTVTATYNANYFRQTRDGASLSERPVLIAGMPRSGTSLLEQIIASHPATCGAGELVFWVNKSKENPAAELSGQFDPAFLKRTAQEYEQLLQQYSATASRVVDKMPSNAWRLGMVMAVFPNARIIHAQRNPIDTCLSIYFQNFNSSHTYATDLEDLAFYYREYVRIMRHWRSVLPPERFIEVPYESLTQDQEGWSRRIIDFLGLEWDERCLNFHETERKVGTASNWQVRQKIYQTSKDRWRHYENHLGPLMALLELDV